MHRYIQVLFMLLLAISSCKENSEVDYIEQLIAERRYEEALEAVDKLLVDARYRPENERIYYQKGFLEDQIGNIDTAATYYLLYVSQESDEPKAWNNLGHIFNEKGDYEFAINCFNNAISISPHDPIPLSNKARAQFNSELYLEALQTFQQAQEEGFVFEVEDQIIRAIIYYNLDSLEEAKEIFEEVDFKDYHTPQLETYFITLLKLEQNERAKSLMLKALKTFPSDPISLNMASFYYTEIEEDLDKALTYTSESVALDSSFYNLAYQNRCLILLKTGKKAACCELLDKLVLNGVAIYPELLGACAP